MKIELRRKIFSPTSTIGEFFVNDTFECYCIEDVDRGLKADMTLDEIKAKKVHAQTCIPYGEYDIIVNLSNRFGKLLPLLVDVPGFSGVRIHPGNYAKDTEGCLLPGMAWQPDMITSSKAAFSTLFGKIMAAIEEGEKVNIKITKGNEEVV